MATRSERLRYEQERAGPDKAPRARRPRPDRGADTSKPGVGADDRRAGGGNVAERNFSLAAKRNAVYALEDSAGARPSRLSTRKSANRAKPSHVQQVSKTADLLRGARRPARG